MKIAVDLDGVCYEWQRTYRYMMREYRGVEMPPVEDFWFYWNACDQFTDEADRTWIWTEGVRLGLFRYGHMTTGARIGLQGLAAQGHEIEVATHRPANAVNDTLDWLSLYFKDIPLAGVHILSNGESKTVLDADVLVDDKTENVQEWVTSGRTAIRFVRPWNSPVDGARDAFGWGDVTVHAAVIEAEMLVKS